MIVSEQQIQLGALMARRQGQTPAAFAGYNGAAFGDFGFLPLIMAAVSAAGSLISSLTHKSTAPAPPPATINVNVPPPPPISFFETPGGTLAVLGGTGILGLLAWGLVK